MKSDIYPGQLRAARALLGITRAELAAAADTTERTIARLEDGETRPHKSTNTRLIDALNARGIELIEENGGGAGVRFRSPSAKSGQGS